MAVGKQSNSTVQTVVSECFAVTSNSWTNRILVTTAVANSKFKMTSTHVLMECILKGGGNKKREYILSEQIIVSYEKPEAVPPDSVDIRLLKNFFSKNFYLYV